MKRIFASLLLLALAAGLLAGCGAGAAASSSSSSAAPKDYVQIILDARAADFNEAYPIIHGKAGETPTLAHNPFEAPADEAQANIDMTLSLITLDPVDCDEYALSVSLMNVKAYCVAIVKPAEGRTHAVKEALNAFVTSQQKAQENYLPDQYEIAKNAIVRETKTGEVILVMSEDAEAVASSIEKALP